MQGHVVCEGRVEAPNGEHARPRAGSDVDRGKVVALANRQPAGNQESLEYLDHAAKPVGQMQDQVGERLGIAVKVEPVAISQNTRVLDEHFASPVAVSADDPSDEGLYSLTHIIQHALRDTR